MLPREVIDWLFSLHRFGMKLGLENIRTLTEDLGRPQDRFKSILIAGTNGKGSTAAMLHQVLLAAGIRSGLYTSPHLVRTEERIRIGAADIESAELSRSLAEVRARIDALLASGKLTAHPTFFEVMTAAAFVAFARAGVEMAVLEVGLGGRLDATNVVEPVLSIITNIDLDHQEQLGDSLDAIAREKAGILRGGVLGLIGETREEPLAALREEADIVGARLVLAHEGCIVVPLSPKEGSRGEDLALTTPVRSYPRIHCVLPGAHQRANVLLAVAAAEILAVEHPSIDAIAVTGGVEAVRWGGRLEWRETAPPILLDGAHNPAGCRALADYLATLDTRPVLIFAAMRDKAIAEMLTALLPAVSAAVFTRAPVERAAEPSDLLETARAIGQQVSGIDAPAYLVEADAAAALARARALAGPRGVVLVAGSLFLIGAVTEILDTPRVRPGAKA